MPRSRTTSTVVLAFTGGLAAAFGIAALIAALTGTPGCTRLGPETTGKRSFAAPPCRIVDENTVYDAHVETSVGSISFLLDPRLAPRSVNNFVFLARAGAYDGTRFHQVVNVQAAKESDSYAYVQGGDPTGTGRGGPGYVYAGETPSPITRYVPGAVAMAHPADTGPESNGSQFFIVVREWRALGTPATRPNYTVFGYVTDPDSITTLERMIRVATADGKPLQPIVIQHVTIEEQPRFPDLESPLPSESPSPSESSASPQTTDSRRALLGGASETPQ